ncbi:hypothetical protein V2G26_016981 [Clonostachys chloroleuca]
MQQVQAMHFGDPSEQPHGLVYWQQRPQRQQSCGPEDEQRQLADRPNPPSSQKATPAPGSRAASPRKRDASEDVGEESENAHKKKKLKAGNPKKITLKTGKPSLNKKDSKPPSQLSQEHKAGPTSSPGETAPKKSTGLGMSPVKKLKASRPIPNSPLKNGGDAEVDSESSMTMSSPPVAQTTA